jgi:4-diphosphocytidyl-2-C-methyl-D-erythritol kinase
VLIERAADAVKVWAPAKVNLFLEVLGKRPDGYHEVATLLVAVSLYDTLVFTERPGDVALRCDTPDLSTGPDNLVCRAAELLRQHTGCGRGALIDLYKRIPMAAGLAGGSSDAAATLAGLNRLWRLNLSRQELMGLSARLGSDPAFFFATPAAWCEGRGERVTPLAVGGPLWFVLASPPVGLSTAAVYREVTVPDQPQSGDAVRRALEGGSAEEIGRHLHNRLQAPAERLCPEAADLRRRLVEVNPAGALVSGSGSSVFALGRDRADALRVARALRQRTDEARIPTVNVVRSCS